MTVAVSLADKLDTLVSFFAIGETPTGSKDPFALRRAAISVIALLVEHRLRLSFNFLEETARNLLVTQLIERIAAVGGGFPEDEGGSMILDEEDGQTSATFSFAHREDLRVSGSDAEGAKRVFQIVDTIIKAPRDLLNFFADRLKVQQREAGVRHDLIDAVFALGGEDDFVRLLARVRALQGFVETAEGADLLAGYKRAANILKKENYPSPSRGEGGARSAEPSGRVRASDDVPSPDAADAPPPSPQEGEGKKLSYTPLPEEAQLIAALDSAEPRARAAVEAEEFEGAMAALASLRGPVDAFFEKVTVNDPDQDKRAARLALLARMRDAVHQVADFSRIEG